MPPGEKIFQKPLAGDTRWDRFKQPMRTGAPFFLLKDGVTGRRQNKLCARRPVFFSEERSGREVRRERQQSPASETSAGHRALSTARQPASTFTCFRFIRRTSPSGTVFNSNAGTVSRTAGQSHATEKKQAFRTKKTGGESSARAQLLLYFLSNACRLGGLTPLRPPAFQRRPAVSPLADISAANSKTGVSRTPGAKPPGDVIRSSTGRTTLVFR